LRWVKVEFKLNQACDSRLCVEKGSTIDVRTIARVDHQASGNAQLPFSARPFLKVSVFAEQALRQESIAQAFIATDRSVKIRRD